jgi:hypothetical protein
MNADGSRGVATDVSVGADVRFLDWIYGGLLAFGVFLASIAALLIVLGIRKNTPPPDAAPTITAAPATA